MLDNAEVLISVVAGLGLDLALPPGIPTHLYNVTKKWTRLDQGFIAEEHLDMIITCDALEDTSGINTDHLPILTTLDLKVARVPTNPPKNFRNVDWEAFEKALSKNLETTGPKTYICTTGELQTTCEKADRMYTEYD